MVNYVRAGETMKSLIKPTGVYIKDPLLWVPVEIQGDMNGLAYSMLESYKKGELDAYVSWWLQVGFEENEDPVKGLSMSWPYGIINELRVPKGGGEVFHQTGMHSFLDAMKGYIEGRRGHEVQMDVTGIYLQNANCIFQAHSNKEKHANAIISQKSVRESDIMPFADVELTDGRIKVMGGDGWMESALP